MRLYLYAQRKPTYCTLILVYMLNVANEAPMNVEREVA